MNEIVEITDIPLLYPSDVEIKHDKVDTPCQGSLTMSGLIYESLLSGRE